MRFACSGPVSLSAPSGQWQLMTLYCTNFSKQIKKASYLTVSVPARLLLHDRHLCFLIWSTMTKTLMNPGGDRASGSSSLLRGTFQTGKVGGKKRVFLISLHSGCETSSSVDICHVEARRLLTACPWSPSHTHPHFPRGQFQMFLLNESNSLGLHNNTSVK